MDILDNIMFATFNSPLTGPRPIESDYISNPAVFPVPIVNNGVWNFPLANKLNFCASEDVSYVEKGIIRHWYDVDQQADYRAPLPAGTLYSSFATSSTYHLIYAYLIENTRILQIFERLIDRYVNDEELGIVNQPVTFNWIYNTERLFFKSDTPKSINIRSLIRPSSDASRRNAYHRMFGMDLAFGDMTNGNVAYTKANSSNQQFVVLFERYLTEIWQAYTNARNTSGSNTSDVNYIIELARQLQEMLAARRGDVVNNTYAHLNLSREEFYSVLMTTWFAFVISYDSPIVNHLNCQSSTMGERLMKIGTKVGIPAHGKCQYLFEMSNSAASVLLAIESGGFLTNTAWVQTMLSSLDPSGPQVMPQATFMNHFLTVINNWEKATGHKIKNPEANITGTVRLQQNGTKAQPVMN